MKKIPQFPKFSKLYLEHKQVIENIIEDFDPYSDFNFTSLWTYNTEEKIEISILHDNLVVMFQDYITKEPFYSFLGKNNKKKTIDLLFDHSVRKGLKPVLKLIPDIVIDKELGQAFNVKEDVDNHDYILSTKEIAELKGKKYYDKRNLINRFKRKFPDYSVRKLNISRAPVRKHMIDLFSLWEKQAKRNKEDTENELNAIKRIMSRSEQLKISGIGIYHDNHMVGFATYETIHRQYGIMSFEKGDRIYDGIYSLLNHEVAKDLMKNGCLYINYEQDMGIAGLKKAKSLWRPVHYLKKYLVSPKKSPRF